MSAARLPLSKTEQLIGEQMSAGLHIGAQGWVELDGQVGEIVMGEAAPGVPMRSDTLVPWRSAGKPLTAVAIGQLWERGRLELDDPVAQHVPEFAQAGKAKVTIRHLLTHTAGFRRLVAYDRTWWDEVKDRLCAAPLERNAVPGTRAGYDADSSWIILGEIVRRVSREPIERYVRTDICAPSGMTDTWLCMSRERHEEYGEQIGKLVQMREGQPPSVVEQDSAELAEVCRPGSSARGPMRDLAAFYGMLRDRGAGRRGRVLMPEAVEAMTARHRVGMFDQSFQATIDWGLGFIINSAMHGPKVPYGFGPHASRRAFGHGGRQSVVGMCDPEVGLVVAIAFNGTPGEEAHDRRLRGVMSAVYEDLGLVPSQ